jgi:hypothetical protein
MERGSGRIRDVQRQPKTPGCETSPAKMPPVSKPPVRTPPPEGFVEGALPGVRESLLWG